MLYQWTNLSDWDPLNGLKLFSVNEKQSISRLCFIIWSFPLFTKLVVIAHRVNSALINFSVKRALKEQRTNSIEELEFTLAV